MEKPRITVIGSNMVDLVTYIERMPREGETIEAPRFEMGFGGKGANQAVAAALMGAEVAMITKIGDDVFGPDTKKNLERYGVNTDHVEKVPGISSGVAPIFVDPSSRNSILIVKGANAHLTPADIDRARELIAQSDLVIMQLEVELATVYHTIALCEELGVPAILNPAPANPALDAGKIASVFIFAPNETELGTLTGMPVSTLDEVRSAAKFLLGKGLKRIIVTLGEKGSLYISADEELLVPVYKVKSVDTTGAGDAFIGCFAVTFAETRDLQKSLERANKYAAISTMKNGTQKSFPDRNALESYK